MKQHADITSLLSSRMVQYFSIGAILLACKKPPEVATPVPVTVETVTDIANEIEQSNDTDLTEDDAESSTDDQNGTSQADVLFADDVNNAVALLTGDEQSVQRGLEALQSLDKENESSAEVPYNIGVAQLKLDNERAAQKSFERAIEIDPTFAKAWFNLGVMLERGRQYESAIAIYEEGLSHSETDPDLSAGKIACLRKLGRLEESIVYAQQVLGKNANNVAAYSEVGAVYLEQGNLDKALFVLKQAAARNGSENAKLQSVLGQVYYAQEKLPLAEQAFRKSLELDPTLIETAMYLSFLQLQNRAWSAANETLEGALKLDPSNAALLNAHGVAKRGMGEIDEAERLYKESYQLNPSNPEPLLNLAVLEADYRNEYTKAFELLDRYVDEGGQDTVVVDTWRAEFKESEAAYLKEKKQQELRELFRRRREEAAKKRAEEEAKRAAEEAEQAEESTESVGEGVEEDSGSSEDSTGEVNSDTNGDDAGVDSEVSDDADGTMSDDGSGEVTNDTPEDNGWGGSVETESAEESMDEKINGEVPDEAGEETTTEVTTPNSGDETSDDSQENTWGNTDTIDSVETEDDSDGDSSDGMTGEGDSEITGSDASGDSDSDQGDAPSDAGWGAADEVQTCASQSDCSEDRVCASTGQCLFPDDFGTTLEGEECATTDQCAISLTCTEGVCAQEESTSDDEE